MPAPIDWRRVARTALLSRRLDELEIDQLTPQGKIKYQFSASGHELSQILLAQALDHPHDAATVYYRSRPLLLACGLTPAEALAAGMARSGGLSDGRDIGVVFNLPRRDGPTILPASGDVGAQYTPAAGWAQAIPYRQRVLGEAEWGGAIAVALGGEASVASNSFWAALNIATTQRLPLLFFIENNCYGISVPAVYQTPGGDIRRNLASFGGLKTLEGDGTDPAEAWQVIQQAVAHVRSGEGPCLLHLHVVRLTGHTFIDDQSYKSNEERAEEARRDPLMRLRAYLAHSGALHFESATHLHSDEAWQALEAEVQAELQTALDQAVSLPEPDLAGVAHHLFFEGDAPLQGGLRPEGVLPAKGEAIPHPSGPRINFIDAVRRTLEAEMRLNPRLLVFGEDVGVKGGVHGATLDMQKHFGAERVFDTSLSEEGIIGRAVGMALAGLLPVPEIQFRKYADPAHEQITDLGTLRWRTANRFAAPVVVRIPAGFGKKTGDPWHSVSAEVIYAHTLGWRIAYPSNAEDAVGLLRSALRGDDPTIFFEHRALLDTPEGRRPYPGDDFCLPFGWAARLLDGDRLTVVSWGAMIHRCLEAARAFPGQITLLDLRTIIPWDQDAVLESVRQTGKVLVVHEDTQTAGFAGEIITTIAGQAFTYLDAPPERLATSDVLIPYNLGLMEAVLPSAERIKSKMRELLAY
ncbi:MAG: pyruvate dehydrogenase [Chloroflexi bacterium RBG_16_57_11]|nr:MAG: pyruvate dehydrogenase [Chloroflexi bacterium RBG_16_57_11]